MYSSLFTATVDDLLAADSGLLSIFILLDIINSIHHSVLLDRLACIWVDYNALLWFSSHLNDRKQFGQIKIAQSQLIAVSHRAQCWVLYYLYFTSGHIFFLTYYR